MLGFKLAVQYFDAFGNPFTRYHFTVVNRSSIPAELFTVVPGPCGSRTHVDIYDATGPRLYGFCALSDPDQLDLLWFARPTAVTPAESWPHWLASRKK